MRWAGIALVALATAAAGAWVAFGRDGESWPPEWYIDPATSPADYAALKRRATNPPDGGFPPGEATLAYLRHLAVASALDSGERVTDARVYIGNGYVLQLHGRFSTARLSRPPSLRNPFPPFAPCVTLVLDPSTFSATSAHVGTTGKCEDVSFLGHGIELDLDEEPA